MPTLRPLHNTHYDTCKLPTFHLWYFEPLGDPAPHRSPIRNVPSPVPLQMKELLELNFCDVVKKFKTYFITACRH